MFAEQVCRRKQNCIFNTEREICIIVIIISPIFKFLYYCRRFLEMHMLLRYFFTQFHSSLKVFWKYRNSKLFWNNLVIFYIETSSLTKLPNQIISYWYNVEFELTVASIGKTNVLSYNCQKIFFKLIASIILQLQILQIISSV